MREGVYDGSTSPPAVTPEFKTEAVRLVNESDASFRQIARDLGIIPQSLRSWVAAARRLPARTAEARRAALERCTPTSVSDIESVEISHYRDEIAVTEIPPSRSAEPRRHSEQHATCRSSAGATGPSE